MNSAISSNGGVGHFSISFHIFFVRFMKFLFEILFSTRLLRKFHTLRIGMRCVLHKTTHISVPAKGFFDGAKKEHLFMVL